MTDLGASLVNTIGEILSVQGTICAGGHILVGHCGGIRDEFLLCIWTWLVGSRNKICFGISQ